MHVSMRVSMDACVYAQPPLHLHLQVRYFESAQFAEGRSLHEQRAVDEVENRRAKAEGSLASLQEEIERGGDARHLAALHNALRHRQKDVPMAEPQTCTHAHMHTCTHVHMHIYTHAHMHTCTGRRPHGRASNLRTWSMDMPPVWTEIPLGSRASLIRSSTVCSQSRRRCGRLRAATPSRVGRCSRSN